MADLPIAPGQVYIEVEYDYEYKSKDRLITIRQGECYMLVKKANEDWWQVRKEEGTKAFYVPAQYVREVRKALMPPPKPLQPPPAGAAVRVKPIHLDLDSSTESLQRRESSYRHSPSAQSGSSVRFSPPSQRRDSDLQQTPTTPNEQDPALADVFNLGVSQPMQRGSSSSTLPRTRARSPELIRAPLDVDSTHLCDSAGEERRTNDSESTDELSSSSNEHLQTVSSGHSESPAYTNLQELKTTQSNHPPLPSGTPLLVVGEWETHKDQSGRLFYYNQSTQERTWKPPRTRDHSIGHSQADSQSAGDGSEHNHSPPHLPGEAPKTRSLDRKQVEPIVLTKWRHSSILQDAGDKDSSQKPPSPDSDSCSSSPKPPASPSEKCGVLNVTKITENGKKVRKNWTSSWTVLHGFTLLFAKGQGGGTSWFGGGQSKPEVTVDLRGGSVDWASKDKSSRKHVLELKTRHGTELLIQSDSDGVVSEWYRALQDAISTHAWESDEAIEDDLPESPGAEKQEKDKEHRDSKKSRAMKPSASVDASDTKKTRHKLKKFLTRRPTLQAVRDKGYIKDQVFGCSLSDLCHRENTTVPTFVQMCIDHVENNGLFVDGLYRVSGNLAVIQKLRFAVNHDEKVNLADGKWEDIHVTAGALKMYFRELPEPLFTYDLFHDFVSAIKIADSRQRVQTVKDLVWQLPRPNHDTMQALFKHLNRVIGYGEENRMTTQSVAIVFGPTLLRPEKETWNIAVHMVYQNQIVELILLQYENIFSR